MADIHDNSADVAGRPWAKLSELKSGDVVELDGGFTCHKGGKEMLHQDELGLFFFCGKQGADHHYIHSQADNGEHLIGIYGPL